VERSTQAAPPVPRLAEQLQQAEDSMMAKIIDRPQRADDKAPPFVETSNGQQQQHDRRIP